MFGKKILVLLCLFLAIMPANARELVVPGNTVVPFSFVGNKKASALKEGSQIPIVVTQDVLVQNQGVDSVIFKKNQTGYAEVFYSAPPRHYATPGILYVRYIYVPDVAGVEHKLTLNLKRAPKRNPFTVVVPIIAVPVVWLFKGPDPSLFDDKKPDSNAFQVQVHQPFVADIPVEGEPAAGNTINQAESATAIDSGSLLTSVEGVKLISKVSGRVRQNWYPPYLKGSFSGKVMYSIDSEGKLSQAELKGSTGNKKLDLSMLKAVQDSAPFPEAIDFIKKSGKPHIQVVQDFSYSLE